MGRGWRALGLAAESWKPYHWIKMYYFTYPISYPAPKISRISKKNIKPYVGFKTYSLGPHAPSLSPKKIVFIFFNFCGNIKKSEIISRPKLVYNTMEHFFSFFTNVPLCVYKTFETLTKSPTGESSCPVALPQCNGSSKEAVMDQ